MLWGLKERVGHSGKKNQHEQRLGDGNGSGSLPGVGQERKTRVKNGATGAIGNKQGSASEGP